MAKKLDISSEHKLTDLTNIAKTVNPLLRQLLGNNGMLFLELLNSWEEIIGKELSAYCLPQNIIFKKDMRIDGCLNISVLSGAFALEIQQKQRQIIEKINSFYGYPAISTLKIIQSANPDNFLLNKKPIDKVKKKVVSESEESYITELTKDINDNELRKTLENIGRHVLSDKSNQE
ncbi:MAG: DUF721 domain-containing protein [Alphaproteobacteria bacterium]|nr:DUF721 domain-containing protein [Alphaproteobacteria bacterium]